MSYPQLLTPEEKLADAKKLLSLPRIVVICGSTRFMTEMNEADPSRNRLRPVAGQARAVHAPRSRP